MPPSARRVSIATEGDPVDELIRLPWPLETMDRKDVESAAPKSPTAKAVNKIPRPIPMGISPGSPTKEPSDGEASPKSPSTKASNKIRPSRSMGMPPRSPTKSNDTQLTALNSSPKRRSDSSSRSRVSASTNYAVYCETLVDRTLPNHDDKTQRFRKSRSAPTINIFRSLSRHRINASKASSSGAPNAVFQQPSGKVRSKNNSNLRKNVSLHEFSRRRNASTKLSGAPNAAFEHQPGNFGPGASSSTSIPSIGLPHGRSKTTSRMGTPREAPATTGSSTATKHHTGTSRTVLRRYHKTPLGANLDAAKATELRPKPLPLAVQTAEFC